MGLKRSQRDKNRERTGNGKTTRMAEIEVGGLDGFVGKGRAQGKVGVVGCGLSWFGRKKM